MPYALIADVVVAILLVITIIYSIGLNRRLMSMRRDRAKLEKIATEFSQSTARANDSITHLKSTNEALQRQLDTANALRDDLAYLLDRGEKSADRLEDLIREARDKVGVLPAGVQPAGPGEKTVGQPTGTASSASPSPSPSVNNARHDGASARPAPEADDGHDRQQSEAEQALLRALRSAG